MAKVRPSKQGMVNVIESQVDPHVFFDIGSWTISKLPNDKINLTIHSKYVYLMDRLKEAGFMWMDNSQMCRGLMGLGLVSECLYNNVGTGKAQFVINKSKGSRFIDNCSNLEKSFRYLNCDDKTDNMLIENYKKYGDNEYGIILRKKLCNVPGIKEFVVCQDATPVISHSLKNLCNSYSNKPLTEDKFKCNKGADNQKLSFWMPTQFKVISFVLMRNNVITTRIKSDVYRGGLITGLYILCKWILSGSMPSDEYCFSKIMENIYSHASEY